MWTGYLRSWFAPGLPQVCPRLNAEGDVSHRGWCGSGAAPADADAGANGTEWTGGSGWGGRRCAATVGGAATDASTRQRSTRGIVVDLQLQGKNVLITGAGQGVGRELGEAFVAEGANVAFSYNSSGEGAAAAGVPTSADPHRQRPLPANGCTPGHLRSPREPRRRPSGQMPTQRPNATWHGCPGLRTRRTIRRLRAAASRVLRARPSRGRTREPRRRPPRPARGG